MSSRSLQKSESTQRCFFFDDDDFVFSLAFSFFSQGKMAAPSTSPALLYRQTALGDTLVESLDALITEGKIAPDLALKVLAEVRRKIEAFFLSLCVSSLIFLARGGDRRVRVRAALQSVERKGRDRALTRKKRRRRRRNVKHRRWSKRANEAATKKKTSTSSFSPLFSSQPQFQFDSAFLAAISTKVSGKASFKGRLDTYRFCDSVWTFVLRDAVVKLPAGPGGRPPAREDLVKKVKVVAVDSRLASRT